MQEGYWQGETVGKKKDGTLFHQEITLSALPNGGMICICRDISKRRERDEEMQKLALVSNRSNNIILILDNQRRVDWVNDSFLRLTGRTKEEVLGTRFPLRNTGLEQRQPAALAAIRYAPAPTHERRAGLLHRNRGRNMATG